MHRLLSAIAVIALSAPTAIAQTPAARPAGARAAKAPLVEFEMMTWPEVKAAIAAGKTTALVYTGGTEQRGPQNVNGGHTLMARAQVRAIALKLGNAIAMPVLAFSPNRASKDLPGTIGLSGETFEAILTEIAEQSILTGFKNVIVMGDHGGGQPKVFEAVAKKLDDKYGPQGIHVYYCDQVYRGANDAFDEYLKKKGLPLSTHAGIPDTSEMLYLGADKGWVRRDLIKTAVGDPVPPPGQRPERKINNGISGDARPSTVALGKMLFDMKTDFAVRQIRGFLANGNKATGQQ
ncbi:MAG: creatininase family protein [Betaproteobacteria bacterium]